MKSEATPTAEQFAAHLYEQNAKTHPTLRLATDPQGSVIAWWHEGLERWCVCLAWAITGTWVEYPYMPRVNGEELIKQSEFREIERAMVAA